MERISTCKCRERQLGAALAAERARQREKPQAHNHKLITISEKPQAKVELISICKRRARQRGAAQAAERARQRAHPQAYNHKRMWNLSAHVSAERASAVPL